MAVTRMARFAGMCAEISTVTSAMAAASAMASGEACTRMPSRNATPESRRNVTPMPAIPESTPSGMPMSESSSASYTTLARSCFFVAPMETSSPNCRVRSDTEMANAL